MKLLNGRVSVRCEFNVRECWVGVRRYDKAFYYDTVGRVQINPLPFVAISIYWWKREAWEAEHSL